MSNKSIGLLVALLGLLLGAASALADVLGFGKEGFGSNQTMGTAGGVLLLLIGLGLAAKSRST